jgi:hypothetical protein
LPNRVDLGLHLAGRIKVHAPPTRFLFATTGACLRPAHLRRLVLHPPLRQCFRWMGLRRRVPTELTGHRRCARPPPPPSAVDFWVAVEANRARHEKVEEKRAKAEARNRLSSVLSVCLCVGQGSRRPRVDSRCPGLLDRDRNPKRRGRPRVGEKATAPRRRRGRHPFYLFYSIHARAQPHPPMHINVLHMHVF